MVTLTTTKAYETARPDLWESIGSVIALKNERSPIVPQRFISDVYEKGGDVWVKVLVLARRQIYLPMPAGKFEQEYRYVVRLKHGQVVPNVRG